MMSKSHAVQFHNDDVFLIGAVCSFIKTGFEEGATIIIVTTEKHREKLRNQTRFASTVGHMVQQAALAGPVRVFGEMVSVLWAEWKTRAAIRLEELWNDVASRHAFSLLCAYPMSGFPKQKNDLSFLQVCHTHSHVHPAE